MKFLQVQALSRINSYLENLELPASGLKVHGRLECYSRKMVRSDKILLTSLKRQYSGDTGDRELPHSGQSSPRGGSSSSVSHPQERQAKAAKVDANQTAPEGHAPDTSAPSAKANAPKVSSKEGTNGRRIRGAAPDTPPALSLPSRPSNKNADSTQSGEDSRGSVQAAGISFGRSLFGSPPNATSPRDASASKNKDKERNTCSAVDMSTLDKPGGNEEEPRGRRRKSSSHGSRRNSGSANGNSRRERSRSPIGGATDRSANSQPNTPPPGSPYMPSSPFLKSQQLSDLELTHSPVGDLHSMPALKVFASLIECMNLSYEDHDFRHVNPMHFRHALTVESVQRSVNSLLAPIDREDPHFCANMWRAIDSAMNLSDCEVYSFDPDDASDNPFLVDCLWAFNYFFISRKQLLYFSCSARSFHSDDGDDDVDMQFEME